MTHRHYRPAAIPGRLRLGSGVVRRQVGCPPGVALLEACEQALYWLGGYACSPEERRAAALLRAAVGRAGGAETLEEREEDR